jgi:hypothetical protein
MAFRTTHVVQAFVMKRGRLALGQKDVAPTEAGALKRAEALASRTPGAAAIKVVADDETGEVQSIVISGQFGQVPDDFAEQLQNA